MLHTILSIIFPLTYFFSLYLCKRISRCEAKAALYEVLSTVILLYPSAHTSIIVGIIQTQLEKEYKKLTWSYRFFVLKLRLHSWWLEFKIKNKIKAKQLPKS